MKKETFSVPNISCNHCVNAIKNELSEIEGIRSVEGDAGKREVTVQWEAPATIEKIRHTLQDINYPAE